MRISHLFGDPLVREVLEAAERDEGDETTVTVDDPQPLPPLMEMEAA